MPQELLHIPTNNPICRVLMILFLIVAGFGSYLAVCWYLGNLFAENLEPGERDLDVATLAVSLSPSDPLVHWRLGSVSLSKLPLDPKNEAVNEFEKAVSLSPNDYRFWTTLGIAYERVGDRTKAEIALKRAVDLAPSYSQPHWFLGNLLLRSGRYEEAFAELRLASDAYEEFRPQFFILLWEIYGSDFDSLIRSLGDKTATRAQFALHLMKQKRFEEGMRIWGTLSAADKVANKEIADVIIATLIGLQHFHDAMNIWNDIAPSAAAQAVIDRVFDGGFEQFTNYGADWLFVWQVKSTSEMQISIDPSVSHSGSRSLRLTFQARSTLAAVNTVQLVPIRSNTHYDFEFYRKSQNLQSGSTPYIQVINAADGLELAASDGAANGNSDWTRVSLSFETPPKAEAIIIMITRKPCPDTNICPIFGNLWYDDFSLKRRN